MKTWSAALAILMLSACGGGGGSGASSVPSLPNMGGSGVGTGGTITPGANPAPTPTGVNPAPTPTGGNPTPTPTPPSQTGAASPGCPMFPGTAGGSSGGWFHTNVASAPMDSNSNAYIKAYADVSNAGFNIWSPAAPYINIVSTSTALLPISSSRHQAHYSPWSMPWGLQTSGAMTQIESSTGNDGHYQVLTTSENGNIPSCTLWEAGYTVNSGSSFSVFNSGRWDTRMPFSPTLQGGSTADASGIPLTALTIRPEELASGVINHALGWSAIGCEKQMPFNPAISVLPSATVGAGCMPYSGPSGDRPMPYGSHIRLKASFNDAGFTPAAQIIVTALKTYGAYLFDTGCCNVLDASNDQYGSISTYINAAVNQNLNAIVIKDFDVISPQNSNAPN